jgi:hypothetical protein
MLWKKLPEPVWQEAGSAKRLLEGTAPEEENSENNNLTC